MIANRGAGAHENVVVRHRRGASRLTVLTQQPAMTPRVKTSNHRGSPKRRIPPGPCIRNGIDTSRMPRLTCSAKCKCGPLV